MSVNPGFDVEVTSGASEIRPLGRQQQARDADDDDGDDLPVVLRH